MKRTKLKWKKYQGPEPKFVSKQIGGEWVIGANPSTPEMIFQEAEEWSKRLEAEKKESAKWAARVTELEGQLKVATSDSKDALDMYIKADAERDVLRAELLAATAPGPIARAATTAWPHVRRFFKGTGMAGLAFFPSIAGYAAFGVNGAFAAAGIIMLAVVLYMIGSLSEDL